MTQAKRVHSTPRKTASKSKRANAPKSPKSTQSADAERSRLYGSLENPVCECARMAEIAMDAQAAQADYARFAVDKLCDMVLSLRDYGRPAMPIMERSWCHDHRKTNVSAA
jgi:hypothetical protein